MQKAQAFWDEQLTETELKELLSSTEHRRWAYYAGKVMREKRPDMVWDYLSPEEVAAHWEEIYPYLGRRRELWDHLFSIWEEENYVKRSKSTTTTYQRHSGRSDAGLDPGERRPGIHGVRKMDSRGKPGNDGGPVSSEAPHKKFLSSFPFESTNFYLTGGTALSAFYFEHRFSDDLDFFTPEQEDFERIDPLLKDLAEQTGGQYKADTTAPSYRRIFWNPGEEGKQLKIDFVHKTIEQVEPNKPLKNNVRVDTVEDICANKITTLISRCELKDAIDLFFLHLNGYEPEEYFEYAKKKDAGLTFEVFSQITGSIQLEEWPQYMLKTPPLSELNQFYQQLSRKFARAAYPESE